jgi:DNA-binding MarR family transcriptional regulator
MLKILELIIQLHEVTKLLETLLQKELKKDGITLSTQEIICLIQSCQTPNEDIKALAEKSIYTYQHLLFNLNKLERKNFLDLKINPKIQKELFVNFTSKGEEVIKALNDKQKKLLLKNLPVGLENLRDELYIKLK